MYNCPKCPFGTNSPMEFRNHLKENHPDLENPDLAYLHAGKPFFQLYQNKKKATNAVFELLSSSAQVEGHTPLLMTTFNRVFYHL